jgi:hypothetical protein
MAMPADAAGHGPGRDPAAPAAAARVGDVTRNRQAMATDRNEQSVLSELQSAQIE